MRNPIPIFCLSIAATCKHGVQEDDAPLRPFRFLAGTPSQTFALIKWWLILRALTLLSDIFSFVEVSESN